MVRGQKWKGRRRRKRRGRGQQTQGGNPRPNDKKGPNRGRKRRHTPTHSPLPFALVALVLILAIVLAYALFLRDDGDGDNSRDSSGGTVHVNEATPMKNTPSVEWWITYPSKYQESGTPPDHPSWVREALFSGPILILVHSGTCAPCIQQEADVKAVLLAYGNSVTYMDLPTDNGSIRERINDVEEAYYDPAYPGAIPHTVMLYMEAGSIYWYSYVGALGQDIIREHLSEATV